MGRCGPNAWMPIGSEIWLKHASGLNRGGLSTVRAVLTGHRESGHRTNLPERSRLAAISRSLWLTNKPETTNRCIAKWRCMPVKGVELV
jgi:hypothetical protein